MMMIPRLRVLLAGSAAVLAALTTSTASAQTAEFGVWTRAGARISFGERVRLDAFQNIRFDDNLDRFSMSAPELALNVRLVPGLSAVAGYRLGSHRTADLGWRTRHRLSAGLQVGSRVGHLGGGVRVLLFEDLTQASELQDQLAVRSRVHLAWEAWDVVTPTASVEVFNNLVGVGEPGHGQLRLTVGPRFSFGEHHVELFYRYRQRMPSSETVDHIAGLGYRIDLADR